MSELNKINVTNSKTHVDIEVLHNNVSYIKKINNIYPFNYCYYKDNEIIVDNKIKDILNNEINRLFINQFVIYKED